MRIECTLPGPSVSVGKTLAVRSRRPRRQQGRLLFFSDPAGYEVFVLLEPTSQKASGPIFAALLTIMLCSGGCSDPSSPPAADVVETEIDAVERRPREDQMSAQIEPNEVTSGVDLLIVRETKRIKSLPGRTGILAEQWKYSVFAEEIIIRDFFQDRKDGFFLDVGAAWPITGSNTYYLEKHLGWTGIGIDALADFAPDWKKLRPNSKFLVYLVTDKSGGDGKFFKSAGLGISSTNRKHASGQWFGVNVEPEEISVAMTTLNDLLDREGITKVDLVSMDIEGHEFQALKGFDIERFQPELLVVEGGRPVVTKYLEDHGYEQINRYLEMDRVNRYFQPTQSPPNPQGR
jgi:FkbM family methyltransferase